MMASYFGQAVAAAARFMFITMSWKSAITEAEDRRKARLITKRSWLINGTLELQVN
jgi:hypothetical protein